MSGPAGSLPLTRVLGAQVGPGIHHWESDLDEAYVAGAVRRAGRRYGHLAGARLDTAAAFHTAIADALGFPDYYGRNLDALEDCLGDLAETTATETGGAPAVLLWDDWGVLAAADPRVFRVATALLARVVVTLLRVPTPAAST